MPKVLTIIMVARNQFEDTKRALESLAEYTDPADFDLIFFDQSVGPETGGYVPTFCKEKGINCKYIFSKENVGWVTAINHCYALVETELSLTVHNDVIFSKWWLRNMVRKFDSDANIAAVGPVITFALGQQSINYAFQTLGYKVKFLLGLFFMARQSVLNEVKDKLNDGKFWLNPEYGMGDKEELEFCWQIRQLGYKLAIARDVIIEHSVKNDGKGSGGGKTFVEHFGSHDAFYEYQNKQLALINQRLGKEVVNDIYKLELEGKPPKVLIGIITRTNLTHCYFMFSLLGIWGQTPVNKQIIHVPRGHVADSRNRIIEEALKDESYTHVCFIDDDMIFGADTLTKLFMHEEDIITGIAFQRTKPYAPCIFTTDKEKKWVYPMEAFDVGVVPIDASGGYFILAKTDVLRKTGKPWFKYGDTTLGYNDKEIDGTIGSGIGEDVYFGLKHTLAGVRFFADTDLEITHIGYEEHVTKKQYLAYKAETNGTFKTEDVVKIK